MTCLDFLISVITTTIGSNDAEQLARNKVKKNTIINISAGGPSLDVGYWESILSQLKAYLARARLRDRHQELLRSKLYKLKLEQMGEESAFSQPLFPVLPQVNSNVYSD